MAIRFFSHFQIALLLFRLFTCLFYYNFLLLKSPIFRYVTQHKSVVVYRHFGTAYRYRHRRSYGQTPRNNYHHAQHPKEELRPHLDHSRSLQSHVVLLIIKCVLILDKNVIMNIKYSQGDRIQFYIVVVLSSHQWVTSPVKPVTGQTDCHFDRNPSYLVTTSRPTLRFTKRQERETNRSHRRTLKTGRNITVTSPKCLHLPLLSTEKNIYLSSYYN